MSSRQISSFRRFVQQSRASDMGSNDDTIPTLDRSIIRWRHKCTTYIDYRTRFATFACCFAHNASGWRFPRSCRHCDGHCLGSIHGSRFYVDRNTTWSEKSQRSGRMLQTSTTFEASILQWVANPRRRLLLSIVQCKVHWFRARIPIATCRMQIGLTNTIQYVDGRYWWQHYIWRQRRIRTEIAVRHWWFVTDESSVPGVWIEGFAAIEIRLSRWRLHATKQKYVLFRSRRNSSERTTCADLYAHTDGSRAQPTGDWFGTN